MDDNNNLDDDYLTSLLGDDFFGMNEINLYCIDDKDNYDLGNINEKAYSVNNYKDLIESIGEDKGIVKMTLSKDAKVCNISEEITEELINQKKEEGYDIIAYEKNGQYEYIILNEKAIDKKQFLSKEEALKDYALEEEKYQNLIKALLGEEESQKQEQEAKKRKNNPEPVITEEMKQAREELTKQMQMLGLLDIDESVEYSQLNDAYNAVSQAKIDINYGFLRMVIELLSGMDVAPLEISNAVIEFDILKDLELDCDISFIENYKEDIKELYSVSSSGGAGGLIKSYAQRLKELRSSLQELSPDYSYYETANYLTYMGEFAADLNWTDKEIEQKAKEIGDEETQRLRDQLKVKAGKFKDIEIDEIILDDDRKQTKEVREQIDLITSLVNSNQNLSTTVAYKIASDIELSEAELGFYENRKDQKEFIELIDVYSEAIFAEASYNVIFGEATEKDWEIYNDKEKQAKYADIYKRDISIRFMNDLSVPEKDRGERQKAFLARHESDILNWGSGTWQKYDLDNQYNNDGIISSDVIDILDNRENSLKSKLSELNINSIFDNTSSKTSVYDKMSDTELYIINAYTTLMINKTVERMQPVLEREDKRKRLNAYKELKQYYYNGFSTSNYQGQENDENGNPIYGFGDSLSDETKEYLFSKNVDGTADWANYYWRSYYYGDGAIAINVNVLNNQDMYDTPTLNEYHNLFAEESELNKYKESDQNILEQCKKDYAKFKEAFYDSKATLIERYPSDDPKQRAIEEDFLLERDQYKISLETEKLSEKVLQNNKELEKIKDDWEYTFDNLEKDLKKYAKKLGYDKNNLTAADLEVILEKYLNDSDVKSIKTSKKTSMDNTLENRELILSAYKQRNALNKEQLTLSDTITTLQNVNLSLYTLYSDFDENKSARIASVKVEKCQYWGERLVYAYDENGNQIDVTAADLAIFCSESKENYDLLDGAFDGPRLYIIDTKGIAKSIGHSIDVTDIVTGINYIPNKEEYYDLVSYLTNVDAKNGTNNAYSAAVEIADMGKRIEGARLAKERQEKIDKAARTLGKIFTLGKSAIVDEIFDIDSSYYMGQEMAAIGVGLGDGLAQFWNGLRNICSKADGKVSAEDYARMYYAQGLKDNFGSIFLGTYEVCTSIGNMLPTIAMAAIGAAITYFSGGTAAPVVAKIFAGIFTYGSKVLMGVSAAGNAMEQGMQAGMSLSEALVYGGFVGTSEVLLEKLLGGIPYLSDTPNLIAKLLSKIGGKSMQKFLASSVGSLLHEMFSEAIEEGLQEILDPVFKSFATRGRIKEEIDWEAVGKSALYGALTAGIMQGSGKLAKAGLSVALTGNSNGLKVALMQMVNQKHTNLLDNFDIFKNNIEAIRKNGKSLELIKASLKVDPNVKTKYDQYVDIFLNNQNALGNMEFMSFDQYVENLALNSIIGINASEGNIDIFNTKIESLNNKINDINAKLENETDVLKINELVKQRENINKQIEECNTQIKHYEFFKQFNGNYQNAALLYANNMFSSMIETILEENGVIEGIDKIKSSEIESLFAQLETSYKIDQSKYSEIVNGLKSTDTVGFQEQMSKFLGKDLTMSDIIEIQNILKTFGVDQSLIKNLFTNQKEIVFKVEETSVSFDDIFNGKLDEGDAVTFISEDSIITRYNSSAKFSSHDGNCASILSDILGKPIKASDVISGGKIDTADYGTYIRYVYGGGNTMITISLPNVITNNTIAGLEILKAQWETVSMEEGNDAGFFCSDEEFSEQFDPDGDGIDISKIDLLIDYLKAKLMNSNNITKVDTKIEIPTFDTIESAVEFLKNIPVDQDIDVDSISSKIEDYLTKKYVHSNGNDTAGIFYDLINLTDLDANKKALIIEKLIQNNKFIREAIYTEAYNEIKSKMGSISINGLEDFQIGYLLDDIFGVDFIENGYSSPSDQNYLKATLAVNCFNKFIDSSSTKEAILWGKIEDEYHPLMNEKYLNVENTTIGENFMFLDLAFPNWNGQVDGAISPQLEQLWGLISSVYVSTCTKFLGSNIKYLFPSNIENIEDIFGNIFKTVEFPQILKDGSIDTITFTKVNQTNMTELDTYVVDINDIIYYYQNGIKTGEDISKLNEYALEMLKAKIKHEFDVTEDVQYSSQTISETDAIKPSSDAIINKESYSDESEIFTDTETILHALLDSGIVLSHANMGQTGVMYEFTYNGKTYLVKPGVNKGTYKVRPFRVEIQKAASLLQNLLSDRAVDIQAYGDGNVKVAVQEKIANAKMASTNEIITQHTAELLEEYVIDYLLGNFDSDAENFIIDSDGKLRGIDKEQAFKYLLSNTDESLALDFGFSPAGSKQNIYPQLLEYIKQNGLSTECKNVLTKAIQTLSNISDADYIDMFASYALAVNPSSSNEIIEKILQRKEYFMKNINSFMDNVTGVQDCLSQTTNTSVEKVKMSPTEIEDTIFIQGITTAEHYNNLFKGIDSSSLKEYITGLSAQQIKNLQNIGVDPKYLVSKNYVDMTTEEIRNSIAREIELLDPNDVEYKKKKDLLHLKEAYILELKSSYVTEVEVKMFDKLSTEVQAKIEKYANEIYNNAQLQENSVTQDMHTLEEDGCRLEGLDFKLKSLESIKEKIARIISKGGQIEAAAADISDSLRYTLIVPSTNQYESTVIEKLAKLQALGYNIKYVNNWWGQSIYQGLNVGLTTPDGLTIELQFHTENSYNVKQFMNHELYEIYRSSTDQIIKDVCSQIQSLNQKIYVGNEVVFNYSSEYALTKAINEYKKFIASTVTVDTSPFGFTETPEEYAESLFKGIKSYGKYDWKIFKNDYVNEIKQWQDKLRKTTILDKNGDPLINPNSGKAYTQLDLLYGYKDENGETPIASYSFLNTISRARGKSDIETINNLLEKNSDGTLKQTPDGKYCIKFYHVGWETEYIYDPDTSEVYRFDGDGTKKGLNRDGSIGTVKDMLERYEYESKALSEALKYMTFKESILLKRGTRINALRKYGVLETDDGDTIYKKLTAEGNIYVDEGFMSTSPTYGFDGNVQFRIRTKVGGEFGNFVNINDDEGEVLLNYGSKFEIKAVKKDSNGIIYIYMDQI